MKKLKHVNSYYKAKPNNVLWSYSAHSAITIGDLSRLAFHIGNPKKWSHKFAHKFLVGNFNKIDIMNLIWTRRILVYQINSIINYATRGLSWKLFKFSFASVNSYFHPFFQYWKYKYEIDCFGMWNPGTFSANNGIDYPPFFAIVPDCSKSARIVIEAHSSAIPVIGLTGSNNFYIDRISYPVVGNETSKFVTHFFCRLCTSLLIKSRQKATFSSCTLKKSLLFFNQIRWSLKNKKAQYKKYPHQISKTIQRKAISWIRWKQKPFILNDIKKTFLSIDYIFKMIFFRPKSFTNFGKKRNKYYYNNNKKVKRKKTFFSQKCYKKKQWQYHSKLRLKKKQLRNKRKVWNKIQNKVNAFFIYAAWKEGWSRQKFITFKEIQKWKKSRSLIQRVFNLALVKTSFTVKYNKTIDINNILIILKRKLGKSLKHF